MRCLATDNNGQNNGQGGWTDSNKRDKSGLMGCPWLGSRQ